MNVCVCGEGGREGGGGVVRAEGDPNGQHKLWRVVLYSIGYLL